MFFLFWDWKGLENSFIPPWSKYILILVSDQNQNFCYFLSRNGILHISQGFPKSPLLHEACPDYSNHKTSLPFRSSAILYLKLCILSFLWLFTSPGTLSASISLVALRDLTWNRSCINEWMRPEPGEEGVNGQKSGGGRVWYWIWDRLKTHSESKEDRNERQSKEDRNVPGIKWGKRQTMGNLIAKVKSTNPLLNTVRKEEILENMPDCIWTPQARTNTILQPAGYLLLHFSLFSLYIVSNRGAAQYLLYNLYLESCKEPKFFNLRNCPGGICN